MMRKLTDFETVRAQDLLVQRATEGMTDIEQAELEELGASEVDGFEVAAAAVDLATLPREPLPRDVADEAFAAAMAALGGRATAPGLPTTAPAVPVVAAPLPLPLPPAPRTATRSARPRFSPRVTMFAGWATAAAVATVAGVLWFNSHRSSSPQQPAAARSELVATVDDAVAFTWVAASPGQPAQGDVVWSAKRQRGYLTFHVLPLNQPSSARYQVWIFDRARDERYPVDGGLFDASTSGDTVVEIDPRVPIADVTQFMLTAEGPAGAVVSDRSHVIAIAKPR